MVLTRVDLPADALALLIGPSGSGKSTWAARQFQPDAVLSSDAFRALVAGNAADQAATADAFKVLHVVARARTRRGLLTVIDATNLTQAARRSLLRLGSRASRPVVAIAFDISIERCLAQNARRPDRHVPDEVIRKHHREMAAALERLPGEGYAAIEVLQDADIETD